jgi:hypothetical protein
MAYAKNWLSFIVMRNLMIVVMVSSFAAIRDLLPMKIRTIISYLVIEATVNS